MPVPLYYTGDANQPADFVWNTSTPSTVTPGFTTDTGGFFVALGAEWTAGGGGGSGGPVGLPRGNVSVSNGNAQVPVRCLANAQCAGQLLLQSGAGTTARDTASTAAGRAFAARIATYGSASFTISKRTAPDDCGGSQLRRPAAALGASLGEGLGQRPAQARRDPDARLAHHAQALTGRAAEDH